MTNTLAYYDTELIMSVNSFMKQTPCGVHVKNRVYLRQRLRIKKLECWCLQRLFVQSNIWGLAGAFPSVAPYNIPL